MRWSRHIFVIWTSVLLVFFGFLEIAPSDFKNERAATHEFILTPNHPDSPYLVINTATGRIQLRSDESIMLNARCSAGSGASFKDPLTGRAWDFSTPVGVFCIQRKAERPLWSKPDWAYLEEGVPVPDDPEDRVVAGELGLYALDLGNGLFIHGTLYTRLLGMNVTHGCIRVDDDDLAMIYHAAEIGMQVFIF